MNLSEISIQRPVFAWMLMFGLIIFGGISFMRMGISQLPDVDYPVVSVNIRLEGAAPDVIETSVVDIIESAVMTIQSIRSVSSRSENSEGTVTIEFELNRDIDLAVQDVQAKFAKLAAAYDCDIEVRRHDQAVAAQSIMGLMMLAAGPGTTIEICAYGCEAESALMALSDLVKRKFDED